MADNPFQNKVKTPAVNIGNQIANAVSNPIANAATNLGYAISGAVNSGGGGSSSGYSSGNKGGSTSSSVVSGGTDIGGYLAQLQAQRQAAAQNAYNNAMSRINDAYNQAASSYGDIFNRGQETLRGSYNNSQNKINTQAEEALQNAYTNRMMSQKNLAQQLAAQGMSGGASESAMAGLLNNYGNSRNGIQKTWNTNLADLEQTFNTNLNDLYSAYQNQMANLANQRASAVNQAEMNLANMIADSSGGLYQALLSNPSILKSALSSATTNQANYVAPEEAVATNVVNAVNTTQNNDMGGTKTNWAEEQLKNALPSNALIQAMTMIGNNATNDQIKQYFAR